MNAVGLFTMIGLLLGGDGLGGIMQGPPRDLASLIDPKAALEQLAVATDEDALIELLTKQGATMVGVAEALNKIGGAAQRGDVDYTKKLLAVRLW